MSAFAARGVAGGGRPAGWGLAPEVLAVLLLGAGQTLAFAPWGWWWVQLLGVAWLAWRVAAQPTARRAALLGALFAWAWLAAGVWWLFVSLHRYGGLPAWLSALSVALLCAFLALYLAAAMAAWHRLRSGRPLADAALFAALWLLAELARGFIFTGFPWLASGYAYDVGPLAAWAPWVGVYGMGAIAAAIAALAVAAWTVRGLQRFQALGLVAALGILPALLPQEFTEPTGTLSVALLQGNVPQDEKFAPTHQPEALTWTVRTLLDTRADLVVASETAIPLLPAQMPDGLWDALRGGFAEGGRAALVGVPLGDFEAGYSNSAAGFSREAHALPEGFYRYDKHHLVPFGEFIPPGFRWFVRMMNMPLGDFERGPLDAPSFAVGGERIAPNICYEDLFGEELAARFGNAATAPTMLVNLSNIGWFGDTVAIPQHLQISRLRALELQRPMLRATNTGATAIVDHRGRVIQLLAPHTRGVLVGEVQGRRGLTPYARWASALGLLPLVLPALALLAWAVWRARRAP